MKEKKAYEDNRKQLEKMHEQMRKKKIQEEALKLGMTEETYLALKNKKEGKPVDEGKHIKVSFEELGEMNWKDIRENKEDDFKPNMVLDRLH